MSRDYKIDEATGCWIWQRSVRADGYGRVYRKIAGERVWLAHRWYYLTFVGPIPDDLELDHRCRNRRCVNPAHLQAVTRTENQLRSPISLLNTRVPEQRAQTHCKHGHPFTEENTYRVPSRPGTRLCRECQRQRDRASYATNPTFRARKIKQGKRQRERQKAAA